MKKQWDFRIITAYGATIFLWASAFPAIRVGLESYNPEHLVLLRLLIASLALIFFAILTRMQLPEWRDIPIILVIGLLGFTVYHVFLSIGETTIHAGTASLLVSTSPIFSSILAALFLHERFGVLGWVGSIISFCGVATLSLGKDGHFTFHIEALFILLASFSESIYFVFQNRYLKKYGFLAFTSYTIWSGTFFMLLYLPGLGERIMHSSIETTLSVVYLGLFPTMIPYFSLAYIISRIGTAEATTSLYLTPALAIIISWIWIGEIPTVFSIIGGIITIFGVIITNIKIDKKEDQTMKFDQNVM